MNSFCWITYHTTCSCKKLLFTMEINWRAGRQKLANFKVIFDLLFLAFISFSNKNINYIMQLS